MPTPDAHTRLINPWLRAHPRPCKYGAPMGAVNRDDAPPERRRFCQLIELTDGGCYGPDGTYWGHGRQRLYAVFTWCVDTLCYYRADSRAHALAQHAEFSNRS